MADISKTTSFIKNIENINSQLGAIVSWLAIYMVVTQFIVVILRYVFGYGSIFMQESIFYMHGFLFLIGASSTLLRNGHVRIDIVYNSISEKSQAKVDLLGSLFFLIPVMFVILWTSFPYVFQSWAVLEGSKESSGIPGIFILKSAILCFGFLMIAQGIVMIIRSICTIRGNKGS